MRLEHNSHMEYYRFPKGAVLENTKIRLRLFVESFLNSQDVYLWVNGQSIRMYHIENLAGGRVYETEISAESPCLLLYYFEVSGASHRTYFGNNIRNLGGLGSQSDNVPQNPFQITVYSKDFKTPKWFKNSIVYQIFPDRFFPFGEVPIDGIKRNWGEIPFYKANQFGSEYTSNDFFGGTLYGIAEKLSYLKELGISAIYLNPIFEAFSNHGYDTGDYENVKKSLGGNKAFDFLCKKAKEFGIKLILDGVFSHTGSDSKYFNKEGKYGHGGAYWSQTSPYFPWYKFNKWPDDYDSWWGFKTLPNVNEEEPSFMEYILTGKNSIVKRWLSKGASGWRLDVVDELPDSFLKRLRLSVKEENPDAIIIGEVWEDASNKVSYGKLREYLQGMELDSVMNYPLRNAILSFVSNQQRAENFEDMFLSLKENYPLEVLYSCLNLISSHDVERALTVLGDAPHTQDKDLQSSYKLPPEKRDIATRRLRLASLLQMVLPGVPCIYYGDEVGMEGYRDPFNRQTYPWGEEDLKIFEYFKELIHLRKNEQCLKTGDIRFLFAEGSLLAIERRIQNNTDVFGDKYENKTMVVVLNCNEYNKSTVFLEAGKIKAERLTNIKTKNEYYPKSGIFEIEVMPLEYMVLEY